MSQASVDTLRRLGEAFKTGGDREAEASQTMAAAMALLWRGLVSASEASTHRARGARRS